MKNLGSIDRTIRTILGVLLVIAAVVLQVTTGALWWLGLVGAVLLGTAAISTCPLYMPFGIKTNKK